MYAIFKRCAFSAVLNDAVVLQIMALSDRRRETFHVTGAAKEKAHLDCSEACSGHSQQTRRIWSQRTFGLIVTEKFRYVGRCKSAECLRRGSSGSPPQSPMFPQYRFTTIVFNSPAPSLLGASQSRPLPLHPLVFPKGPNTQWFPQPPLPSHRHVITSSCGNWSVSLDTPLNQIRSDSMTIGTLCNHIYFRVHTMRCRCRISTLHSLRQIRTWKNGDRH